MKFSNIAVQEIDDYVMAEANPAEESVHSPSIATATPSIPGTNAHTPSIKSSRLSSAQLGLYHVCDFYVYCLLISAEPGLGFDYTEQFAE